MIRRHTRRFGGVSLCLIGFLLLAADPAVQLEEKEPAAAPPAAAQTGRLINIPLPITGRVDEQVMQAVQRARGEFKAAGSRPVLVFAFPDSQHQTGVGSDFSRSLSLARYLSSREVSELKTVAYIPRSLKGHAVLVAMACEEILMAPDAQIGEAGIDEPSEEPISLTVRSGYREIAERRRTIPAEVALAMLDKNAEVLKVETEVSPEFVLKENLDELKKTHTIQSQQALNRQGQLAQFSGREARELGFVKYLAADRKALARALSLPPEALQDDPSLAGGWKPVGIQLKGPITTQLVTSVQRMIEDQIRNRDVNFVCLLIDSPGGSLTDSMYLANYLADLDPTKVRTVAFVPSQARGDAALIAVACDQLVMAPHAVLGGEGAQAFSSDDLLLMRETLRDSLAPKKSRSWSLPAALLDPEVRVFRFTNQRVGSQQFYSDAELQAQAEPDAWNRGEEVTKAGSPLRLDGDRAHDLGLAQHLAPDAAAFKQLYNLRDDLVLAEPGWAHYLIQALASPAVAWLLLLIGGAALYAELQAPGIGVGAFVAGVCFLLYFWSKYLDGTAGWLEVLLFAAGICCVLLELFVLPGSAVFGIGGGLLIIASLVLASQTFVLPRNDYQLGQLRDSLLGLVAAGIGIIIAAVVLRRYLPHTPFFGHVMLEPPSVAELEDLDHRESLVNFTHLLGHQGQATTQLTPSGKARFGNELVDVIADGEVISRGSEVVVVEVHGNRVVVRSVAGRV